MLHPVSPSRGMMQATHEALERGEELNPKEFASRVFFWTVRLSITQTLFRFKMQRNPRMKHIAREMVNDLNICKVLKDNTDVRGAHICCFVVSVIIWAHPPGYQAGGREKMILKILVLRA